MNITEVTVFRRNRKKLKGIASIVIDDAFAVHDIKIIESPEGKLFITMPSRRIAGGRFRDIAHPLKTEVRRHIEELLFAAYEVAEPN